MHLWLHSSGLSLAVLLAIISSPKWSGAVRGAERDEQPSSTFFIIITLFT